MMNECAKFDSEIYRDNKTYRSYRRAETFPVFVNSTDSKEYTAKITANFIELSKLVEHISCSVNDLGVGEGKLAGMLVDYFNGTAQCKNTKIRYDAIEKDPDLFSQSNSSISSLEVVDGNFILGSCFEDDSLNKMKHSPFLLIASHVIYYLNGLTIEQFIQKIFERSGRLSIMVAQAEGSVMNDFADTYSRSSKVKNTETEVVSLLKKDSDHTSSQFLYSSFITFPEGLSYEKLLKIAKMDKEKDHFDDEDLKTKLLLDMIAASPMEYLNCIDKSNNRNDVEFFVKDVLTNLQENGGFRFKFWSYMTFSVHANITQKGEMQETILKIYNQSLSGNLTSWQSAIDESNYEIAHKIFRHGVMSCGQKNHNFSSDEGFRTFLMSCVRYHYMLEPFVNDLFKYWGSDLDKRASYRSYTSIVMNDMHNRTKKYNFYHQYNRTSPAENISAVALVNASFFREYTGYFYNYMAYLIKAPLLYELPFTYIIIFPFFIIKNSHSILGMVLGLSSMFIPFAAKFFETGHYAVHSMNGKDFLFQLYLYDGNNAMTLIFQNGNRQTPLHLALHEKDEWKVRNILSCEGMFVSKLLKMRDMEGLTPFHYAVIAQNAPILEEVLYHIHGSQDDYIAYISFFNLFVDYSFYIGKSMFMYHYFVDWIGREQYFQKYFIGGIFDHVNNILNNDIKKFFALSSVYSPVFLFGMKYPESLYYKIFLHRLNPYDHSLVFQKESYISSGFTYDTPLHLGVKLNITFAAELLANKSSMINKQNRKGESVIHLAAANSNYKLIELFIQQGADVNLLVEGSQSYPLYDLIQNIFSSSWKLPELDRDKYSNSFLGLFEMFCDGTYFFCKDAINTKINIYHNQKHFQSYPFSDFLIKTGIFIIGKPSSLGAASEILFILLLRSEVFYSCPSVISVSPLHYAISGVSLSETNFDSNQIKSNEYIDINVLVKLIENGADPDIYMYQYTSPYYQIIPFILAKLFTIHNGVSGVKALPIFFLSQSIFSLTETQNLFSYSKQKLKAIDLLEYVTKDKVCIKKEDTEIYQYLKQYTVLNEYNDINEFGFLDLKYYLYILKIISDKDEIFMKDYGTYKGGSGCDTFHVYYNYTGKDQGYNLIIRDFTIKEDNLIIYDCSKEKIIFQNNIIYCLDQPLVNMIGIDSENMSAINIDYYFS